MNGGRHAARGQRAQGAEHRAQGAEHRERTASGVRPAASGVENMKGRMGEKETKRRSEGCIGWIPSAGEVGFG